MKKQKRQFKIIAALLVSMSIGFMPQSAGAVQITPRSVTIGSSAASAVTTYAFAFNTGTTGNIGAIKLQLCDSPIEAASCVNSGNSNGVSFTSNSANLASQG